MAERYLFNKSLNRRSSRWPWLLSFAAICTVLMVYAVSYTHLTLPTSDLV